MKHELSDIYFSILEGKSLKKQDVKATERKMETDITDQIGNDEIGFINTFLKKGEKIDGKTIKSIDVLLSKYKKKIGSNKLRTDANIMMLATIVAAMKVEIDK